MYDPLYKITLLSIKHTEYEYKLHQQITCILYLPTNTRKSTDGNMHDLR